ncbi:hypothetical protein GCWU000342_01883 [Shuttleworthella satelles DSM 14600]|uniref:Uncharacterized protein n=1 Tax=Shuttleworthella satelles DSM 14600 TaxID=626523 RepID=C4GD39_9FIRM|nr:hypothetical protein GCWU000342_01883 [Shuttleworthia satelles DSM 14600]
MPRSSSRKITKINCHFSTFTPLSLRHPAEFVWHCKIGQPPWGEYRNSSTILHGIELCLCRLP